MQLLHRTDDLAGDDPDHNGTDDDDRNADKEVKLVGKADRIRDALQRASCKVAVSIVKPADDLQILGIGVAVVEFLDLIVVFAVNDFGICLLVSADQAEDQGLEALAVGCVGIDEAADAGPVIMTFRLLVTQNCSKVSGISSLSPPVAFSF